MASFNVKELSVRLGDPPRRVLNTVSFSAESGTVVLILGANGSGKSVLMRTLLGLHPHQSGTISVDGNPLGRSFRELHRRSGVAFQNPDLQIFGDTVRADLMIGSRHGVEPDATVLAAFGLDDLMERGPYELSGGQRRRLALAGAFIGSPDFLFLDEPFIELDYPHIGRLIEQIVRARDRGAIVFVASHEIRDIWGVTDKVLLLHEGKHLHFGSPEDVQDLISPEIGLRPSSQDAIPAGTVSSRAPRGRTP